MPDFASFTFMFVFVLQITEMVSYPFRPFPNNPIQIKISRRMNQRFLKQARRQHVINCCGQSCADMYTKTPADLNFETTDAGDFIVLDEYNVYGASAEDDDEYDNEYDDDESLSNTTVASNDTSVTAIPVTAEPIATDTPVSVDVPTASESGPVLPPTDAVLPPTDVPIDPSLSTEAITAVVSDAPEGESSTATSISEVQQESTTISADTTSAIVVTVGEENTTPIETTTGQTEELDTGAEEQGEEGEEEEEVEESAKYVAKNRWYFPAKVTGKPSITSALQRKLSTKSQISNTRILYEVRDKNSVIQYIAPRSNKDKNKNPKIKFQSTQTFQSNTYKNIKLIRTRTTSRKITSVVRKLVATTISPQKIHRILPLFGKNVNRNKNLGYKKTPAWRRPQKTTKELRFIVITQAPKWTNAAHTARKIGHVKTSTRSATKVPILTTHKSVPKLATAISSISTQKQKLISSSCVSKSLSVTIQMSTSFTKFFKSSMPMNNKTEVLETKSITEGKLRNIEQTPINKNVAITKTSPHPSVRVLNAEQIPINKNVATTNTLPHSLVKIQSTKLTTVNKTVATTKISPHSSVKVRNVEQTTKNTSATPNKTPPNTSGKTQSTQQTTKNMSFATTKTLPNTSAKIQSTKQTTKNTSDATTKTLPNTSVKLQSTKQLINRTETLKSTLIYITSTTKVIGSKNLSDKSVYNQRMSTIAGIDVSKVITTISSGNNTSTRGTYNKITTPNVKLPQHKMSETTVITTTDLTETSSVNENVSHKTVNEENASKPNYETLSEANEETASDSVKEDTQIADETVAESSVEAVSETVSNAVEGDEIADETVAAPSVEAVSETAEETVSNPVEGGEIGDETVAASSVEAVESTADVNVESEGQGEPSATSTEAENAGDATYTDEEAKTES